MNYYEERAKFRKLPICEQLSIIEERSKESNTIIGNIYIPSFFLESSNRENDSILADVLGNATLLKTYGVMGMGDIECRWIFSIRNLLIGICGTSFYRGPILIGGDYKVYRVDEAQKNTIDIDKIDIELFH